MIKFALKGLKRDWSSGELRLIGISILIAVASLTSVSFFTDRVKRATEQQATELLAADLVLRSSNVIPDKYIEQANSLGLSYSLNEGFRSVVLKDERMELAEVKAVDDVYPIRGELRISNELFGPEQVINSIPKPGHVWLDSRLMQALKVNIGNTVTLGALDVTVSQILSYEPDRGGDLFNIAPRLLMNRSDLESTGLILPGSRVSYKLLLGGSSDQIEQYRKSINIDEKDNVRIEGIRNARPEINRALERAEQFLGLAALVSIALAGLAIAMSAQRYAIRHYDNCAIMRCLGLQQKQIVQLYLMQLTLLALICSLIGCLIGYFAQEGLNQLMLEMTKGQLPSPSLRPVVSGLFAGLVTVLAFALPQLLRLKNISPLRVLRRDLNPVPLNNYIIYLLAIGGLMLLTPWQSGEAQLTFYTIAGLFITGFVLALSARLFLTLLKRFQPLLKTQARYGLANVVRRSNQSIVQIIGIGIGITVMLLLTLVRTDLLNSWQNRLPDDTPNYFLINIQPEQVEQVEKKLINTLDKNISLYPMIRGRLIKINDKEVVPEEYGNPRATRLAQREFNLSYAESMQEDNELVSGQWWEENHQGENMFSVEEGIAETLGIEMNDTLTYSIGGREMTGKVMNLRWVEWDSFNVNFFVVSNPKALIDYPGTFISSFYLPDTKRSLLIDIVREFPSITIFDVDAILKQVRAIMEQVVKTVEFVFIFTILTGLAVLFAALQSTHDERTHEAALMSALGASQKQIRSGLIAEFICLGLVTGILSAVAASLIEWVLAEFVFKIDITINPMIWVIAPLAACVIIVITGWLGTRKVLNSSPMLTLRRV